MSLPRRSAKRTACLAEARSAKAEDERSAHDFRPIFVSPDVWPVGRVLEQRMTPNISRRAAVIVAAVMLMTACTVEAQRVEGSFEKTLTVGPQTEIEIMSGSGSIEVRQGSVRRLEIRAKGRAGDWGRGRRRGGGRGRGERAGAGEAGRGQSPNRAAGQHRPHRRHQGPRPA